MCIAASIVLYNTDVEMLRRVVESYAPCAGRVLYLIDNSPICCSNYKKICSDHVYYLYVGENKGYGAGHNIAIRKSIEQNAEFHVVLNPDLVFDSSVIDKLCEFAKSDGAIGHIMPKIVNPDGTTQFLCKLIPSPSDLIFKRFLPRSVAEKRMHRFQMRFFDYNTIADVPYLSGCFMFLRVSALKEVGIFDERFFMYPEDIDLTRRMHEKYRTVFYPHVSVVHDHAAESYHNFKMLMVHITNMIKYFNKWGWFSDKKRQEANMKVLLKLGYIE